MIPYRPSALDLEDSYSRLRSSFSSGSRSSEGSSGSKPESYNMVLTSSYMMLVPRTREVVGPVAVNSMGFAGSMLVRSKEELDYLHRETPMKVLAAVGRPW